MSARAHQFNRRGPGAPSNLGKRFKPEQTGKQKLAPDFPPEKLIDYKRLEKLEKKKGVPLPPLIKAFWQKINYRVMRFPQSVRLSPSLRRAFKILSE